MELAVNELSSTIRELYLGEQIERIELLKPIDFYRNYVSLNKPVIITGAIKHWKALRLWNYNYLKSIIGNKEVTVDVTPNGYADSIVDNYFVQPEKRKMKVSNFFDILESPNKYNGIYYVMHQNNNFTTEFESLWRDIDTSLLWANETFQLKPEAVNIWIGENRSISSMHKDHYENIYAVVCGEKHFTLLPPTDLLYLYEKPYESSRYKFDETNNKWDIIPEDSCNLVPWISVDPDKPNIEKFPLASHLKPYHCTVRAGEILYLPSMWYHKVAQKGDIEGKTIAINYWYDMQYDLKFAYFKFMESLLLPNKLDSLIQKKNRKLNFDLEKIFTFFFRRKVRREQKITFLLQ